MARRGGAGTASAYWVCSCGEWSWGHRTSCHGCAQPPPKATRPPERWGPTPAESISLRDWEVQPRGQRNQAKARAAAERAARRRAAGAMGSAASGDANGDAIDLEPGGGAMHVDAGEGAGSAPGGLARLRRALAALRAAPETQDEADALAARIRKVETEIAAARPLDARLRSAMDRAASAAQRQEAASGEEAKLQAAWQEAARKREEAAAVSEAAQAEVRQLRSELAPAPVQPGVGTAGLEQAVAMVAGALEAQNAEVTAAVWPFFAAMAAAAARVQGGATAGQDQPAWEGPARPSDGQGATAATPEARSEFCSPEPPMDWQPPGGAWTAGPPAPSPNRTPGRRAASGPTSGRHGRGDERRSRAWTRSRSGEGPAAAAGPRAPAPSQRTLHQVWQGRPRG